MMMFLANLVNLKSSDISYIDIVKSERIYGDIILKGVLAVSLHDKSNSWLAPPALQTSEGGFLQLLDSSRFFLKWRCRQYLKGE